MIMRAVTWQGVKDLKRMRSRQVKSTKVMKCKTVMAQALRAGKREYRVAQNTEEHDEVGAGGKPCGEAWTSKDALELRMVTGKGVSAAPGAVSASDILRAASEASGSVVWWRDERADMGRGKCTTGTE